MPRRTSHKFYCGERSLLWALVSFTCLFAVQSAHSADTLSVKSFTDVLSSSKDVVRMQKNGVNYEVPREFMLTAVLSESMSKLYFNFAFLFPEGTALSKDMATCGKKPEGPRCKDIILVATRDFERPIDEFYSTQLKALVDAPEIVETYGLKKLVGIRSAQLMDTYIAEATETGPPVVITCATSQLITYCRVETANKLGKRFSYDFHKEQLPQWRQIDSAVHVLLDSFTLGDDRKIGKTSLQ